VDCFSGGAKLDRRGFQFPAGGASGLYQACVVKKDFLLGQKLMHAMLPLFYLLEQGGKYLQFVKYGCECAGIPVGHARRPLLGLSPEEKRKFDKLYKAVKSAKLTKLAA
jgi:4-hydroxy-tetrahydrodipicolinate synthase